MHVVLTKLRDDFTAAISSDQNDLTLDTSVASLIDRISGTEFLEAFSIYSRGHLRKLGDHLGEITNVHLKENPLQVAYAVDDVLKLFDRLAITVRQTAASEKRIDARSRLDSKRHSLRPHVVPDRVATASPRSADEC